MFKRPELLAWHPHSKRCTFLYHNLVWIVWLYWKWVKGSKFGWVVKSQILLLFVSLAKHHLAKVAFLVPLKWLTQSYYLPSQYFAFLFLNTPQMITRAFARTKPKSSLFYWVLVSQSFFHHPSSLLSHQGSRPFILICNCKEIWPYYWLHFWVWN